MLEKKLINMKKKYLFIFLSLSFGLFSTPTNNPALCIYIPNGIFFSKCNAVSFRIGYEGNFVSDAKLKQITASSARVDNFGINCNSGSLTLNIKNIFDAFGTLGASRVNANWRISPPAGGLFRIETETRYHFSWMAGGRVVLWHNEKTALGLSGRYYSTKPEISWLTSNGLPLIVRGGEMCYQEWQVAFGLSHQIGIFVPYFGIKYSDVRTEINNLPNGVIVSSAGTNTITMKRKNHVGGFLGVTLTNGCKFLLNIEARLADEEAATVSGQIRF
jgi:hypothetical protein